MRMIEIVKGDNGSHRNQECRFTLSKIPEGWAVIPSDFPVPPSFPFVDLTVEDGIVTKMEELEVPEVAEYVPPKTEFENLTEAVVAMAEKIAKLEGSGVI